MRRLALMTAVIVAVVVGALTIWQMREALALFLFALALATGLRPEIHWLVRRGFGQGTAVALVFGAALILLSASIFILGSFAYAEILRGVESVPMWYDNTRMALIIADDWRSRYAELLPPLDLLAQTLIENELQEMSMLVVDLTGAFMTWMALIFSVAALGFYWLLDQQRFERFWLSLLPLSSRVKTREVWRRVNTEVRLYVRGGATSVALTTLSLLGVYVLLGVPAPTLLALLGGIAQVIPLLGLPIAVLPAVLLALTQGGLTAFLTLILSVSILSVMKGVVAPRVLRGGVTINPVLEVFLIMILGGTLGVVMILFAPPLTAALQVGFAVLAGEAASNGGHKHATSLESLHERLLLLEEGLQLSPHDPRLQGMLERTKQVLADAEAVVQDKDVPPLDHQTLAPKHS